jgi:hypothetical protein
MLPPDVGVGVGVGVDVGVDFGFEGPPPVEPLLQLVIDRAANVRAITTARVVIPNCLVVLFIKHSFH